ncbi:rhodanese-related sulfurtransferase [Parvularcula sp. LCG005]|uniref:oxygen-dependent tRNA uridine(34) hydroxylase TrhO n=1 Tax=Parvularcula sp. LCG005 TaxID=3078805 RepID=UPI00397DC36C
MSKFVVAALYHFARLEDLPVHQAHLREVLERNDVRGTILLATEGVNGTIAGDREGIDAALAAIRAMPGFSAMEHKESFATENPFLRLKVRLKKEIVTLGVPGVSPADRVGTYVTPEDWNDVINDPEVVLIDTRNDYEVQIGTFEGAVNPQTTSFREFPNWWRNFRQTTNKTKVAMFCTGGIRCEKASSFLLSEGVEEVLHLKGGILKYLETVPEEKSTWNGECFVFDGRVSVKHGLEEGDYDQCFACRRPIDDEMKADARYEPGVSCPQCHDEFNEERKAAFAERQRQIRLAQERGEQHLGTSTPRS